MTLAPELPNGLPVVKYLVDQGITASLGHSDATYEEAVSAINHGLSHFTHAFNAMPRSITVHPGHWLLGCCTHALRLS